MKEKHKSWQYLTVKRPNLSIKDWEGIEAIELELSSYRKLPETLPAEIDEKLSCISKSLFGITIEETEFKHPEDYHLMRSDNPVKWEIDRKYVQHEMRYDVSDVSDEVAVEILLKHKIDFRDKLGNPLRCVRFLKRQAESAARNYKGKVSDPQIALDRKWEDTLASSAHEFMKGRKKAGIRP